MSSKQCHLPLPDVVREEDSRALRCCAEHLDGIGLSDRRVGALIGAARHVAIWLAAGGRGLDTFDIRLADRFMRHECHCPSRHRAGRRPGPQTRAYAIRLLRHLLKTGQAGMPPEIKAGRELVAQFRGQLEERGYAGSTISLHEKLCRHFIVWLHLSDIPLVEAGQRIQHRFPDHDCACVHPGLLRRPRGLPAPMPPEPRFGSLPGSWQTGISSRCQ